MRSDLHVRTRGGSCELQLTLGGLHNDELHSRSLLIARSGLEVEPQVTLQQRMNQPALVSWGAHVELG